MTNYRKGSLPIIILGIVAVAALGVGGYFAYKTWSEKPIEILYKAVENLVKSTSFEQVGKASVSVSGLGREGFSGDFSMESKVAGDISAWPAIKGYADIKLGLKVKDMAVYLGGYADFPNDDLNISGDISYKAVGTDGYFKLDNLNLEGLSGLPNGSMLSSQASAFAGKWFKFNIDELEKMSSGARYGRYSYYDQEELKEFINKNRSTIQKFILDTAKKYELFKVVKDLGSEDVDGVRARHYEMAIDYDNLLKSINDIAKDGVAFAKSILPEEKAKYIPEYQPLEEGQITQIKIGMEMVKSYMPAVNIWVKKSGYSIRKVVIAGTVTPPFGGGYIKYDIQNVFDKFNEEIKVEAPADAVDIKEAISQMLSGNFGAAGSYAGGNSVPDILLQSQDASRINDLAMLKSAIALYQNVSPNPFLCAAGKTYYSNIGSRAVNGTGWLPVNFSDMDVGSPIAQLPIDPRNDNMNRYSYGCDPKAQAFEFNTVLASKKYAHLASEDGGNDPSVYEVGTKLDIIGSGSQQPSNNNFNAFGSSSQLASARNSQRRVDVNTILNAVWQRMIDNRGEFNCPTVGKLPSVETRLGKKPGNYNIYLCLVPTYLANMPLDPQSGNADDNGYAIRLSSNGRITVSAPYAELGQIINATR